MYNLQNPINGSNTYFRYTVGGATTAFTFNSFDLRGSTPTANLNFTVHGYLGGVLADTAILNVTGNTFATFTENWANVDTVEIDSTSSLPVNWGSGTLYMDNVVLNNVVTPEPATTALVGTVLVALGILIRKRSKLV